MAPGWEEVIAPLMSISSIWAWVFLFYFFFTYFAVLNVATWNAKQRADGQVACLMGETVKNEKCLGHLVCNSIRQYRKIICTFMHIFFFNKNGLHAKVVGPAFLIVQCWTLQKIIMSCHTTEFQPPVVASFRFSPRWKKLVQVTAVFCQSAIDSAQSDHTMMVQSILDDKAAAIGSTDPYLGLFHGAYQEIYFQQKLREMQFFCRWMWHLFVRTLLSCCFTVICE